MKPITPTAYAYYQYLHKHKSNYGHPCEIEMQNGYAKRDVICNVDSEREQDFLRVFIHFLDGRYPMPNECYYILRILQGKSVLNYIPIPEAELTELCRHYDPNSIFSNVGSVTFNPLTITEQHQ